jgi:crossover junction endodeoxyribonuclease RuvC
MKIFGIDPGSRVTGYGVIQSSGKKLKLIDFGVIKTKEKDFIKRLPIIFSGIEHLMDIHDPDMVAVENVFMHRNADSALKLGQARAAAISGTFKKGVDVFEYSAREVKLAVVGTGSAEKEQVREMVKLILGIKNKDLNLDESDALAIAICHAHSHPMKSIVKELQK